MVALVEPNDPNLFGHYQIPGGEVRLEDQELLKPAASRERLEELIDPMGSSIIEGDIGDRLFKLDSALFHQPKGKKQHESWSVHGFGLRMTEDELARMYEVERYMNEDEGLRTLYENATSGELNTGELRSIKLLPLDTILRNPQVLARSDQLLLFVELGEYLESKGQFMMPDLVYHTPRREQAFTA